MQTPFQSHLTVLESSGSLYASSPAFKVPKLRPSGQIQDWETITYNQFKDDVEASARYWERLLSLHGIPRKSVIGLWQVLSGYRSHRFLTVSRAGLAE
jgi:hypothetical protein